MTMESDGITTELVKECVDVYDCGIKIWEKKDNGET